MGAAEGAQQRPVNAAATRLVDAPARRATGVKRRAAARLGLGQRRSARPDLVDIADGTGCGRGCQQGIDLQGA